MVESESEPAVAVVASHPTDLEAATALGQRLGLPVLASEPDSQHGIEFDALLRVESGRLAVQRTGRAAPGPVSVDFGSNAMRYRRHGGHNELLGKAVGVGKKKYPLRVLDATAGLGRDSFVLADLGCEMLMCERVPLIEQMLRSGMEAALAAGDPWLNEVLGRMQLKALDARELAPGTLSGFDVIYLDPMFPGRDKSAAVKKEMAIFQLLLGGYDDPGDADDLLQWALSQNIERVVVKRPARAPSLMGPKPSHDIGGKAVRYDVYQRHSSS